MAAQLTGADRCVVAMLERRRSSRCARRLRMPDVANETGWREAMDAVVKGAGPTLVQPANRRRARPSAATTSASATR